MKIGKSVMKKPFSLEISSYHCIGLCSPKLKSLQFLRGKITFIRLSIDFTCVDERCHLLMFRLSAKS